MSDFRSRMHPLRSRAEDQVFEDLSADGLTMGLNTCLTIDLSSVASPEFLLHERFETIPDFSWARRKKAEYLDGDKVHRGKRLDTDETITDCLRKLGWDVKRIRYSASLSKKRRAEIREENRRWLKK